MEKKHLGKTLVLVALSTTLLGASLPAQAMAAPPHEVTSIQPCEIGIATLNCRLDISSSGKARCLGEVTVKAGYDAEVTLALQRRTSGRPWSDVTSWTDSGTSTLSESRYVTSGYDYRCELTVDVYSSSGKHVAPYTEYSDIVPY